MRLLTTTSPRGTLGSVDWAKAGTTALIALLCTLIGGTELAHATGKLDATTASALVAAAVQASIQLWTFRSNGPTKPNGLSL